MEQKTDFKKLYAILIYPAIAAVVFLILFLGTKQTYDSFMMVQQVRADEESQLSSLQQKQQILYSLDSSELSNKLTSLSSAIPDTVSLPVILATLQSVAGKSQVQVSNFTLSSSQSSVDIISLGNNQLLSSFEFTVDLDGSFDNIQSMINNLSTVTPLMTVKKIVFGQNSTKLTLDYYFQPIKTQSTASQTNNQAASQPGSAAQPNPSAQSNQATQAFPKIGTKEEAIISKVQQLNPPVLTEGNTPNASTSSRVSPF